MSIAILVFHLYKLIEYHKGAFSFQISHNLRNAVFRRYGDQHMDMVRAKFSFDDFYFFPFAETS
ncbi:hypothetical protein JS73_03570 [Synergistes jonesii]|uniref:Uncharacterized protein n=1 Tax=Synergistes jonesii TaxID=2754 RepID=A0A073J570_9BACT|nr:hypothetical protein EH55_00215 [Synergistes jonesii]OFB64154.1 hypothetical protein JS73_03570 [Synergistes jonesii]OFB64669.1 hypothetical protein JS72_03765 [Synergistes jonesii]OFB65377.1 hypothetical protein JS79_04170 [Synergistes jonesii]OFB68416.1 hypothetical protein JS78_03590 [Synergistes jonesii]